LQAGAHFQWTELCRTEKVPIKNIFPSKLPQISKEIRSEMPHGQIFLWNAAQDSLPKFL
jgi:hypothetical protein